MPSGCKNKTCNGVAHAFVPFPFPFRLRSVHGILRSPFSCFKCRLVVWDATAASKRTRMSRGKKIMKTATLIMKVFRRAASSPAAPRPWLVSFEIIICAMEPSSSSSTFSCCVPPHVVNFASYSARFKDLRSVYTPSISIVLSSAIPLARHKQHKELAFGECGRECG